MRRLHPLTILLEMAKAVQRLIVVLLFFAVATLMGGERDNTEVVLAGLGLFVGVSSALRYISFRFTIDAGELVVQEGIITRKRRTIPLDRIQNVRLTRTLFHRILGLVDVQIETAAGSGVEASLSALAAAEGEVVKAALLGQALDQPAERQESGRLLLKLTPRELFLAGASENRALPLLFGLMSLFGVVGASGAMRRATEAAVATPWIAAGVALALLLAGWVWGIVRTLVTFGDFQLRLEGGRLTRRYGLLSQQESVIRVQRVQDVRFEQTWLQRRLGVGSLKVETAASVQEKAELTGSLLTPLVESGRAPDLVRLVLPSIESLDFDWRPLGKGAPMRQFRASLLGVLLAGLVVWRFGWGWGLGAAAAFVLVQAVLSPLRVRASGWADLGHVVAWRQGLMRRVVTLVPCAKIQSVKWVQSPLQRKLNLATLVVSTAGSTAGVSATMLDLDVVEAEVLLDALTSRSAAWAGPDGV